MDSYCVEICADGIHLGVVNSTFNRLLFRQHTYDRRQYKHGCPKIFANIKHQQPKWYRSVHTIGAISKNGVWINGLLKDWCNLPTRSKWRKRSRNAGKNSLVSELFSPISKLRKYGVILVASEINQKKMGSSQPNYSTYDNGTFTVRSTNMSSTHRYIVLKVKLRHFAKHFCTKLVLGKKYGFLKSSDISTFPDISQEF